MKNLTEALNSTCCLRLIDNPTNKDIELLMSTWGPLHKEVANNPEARLFVVNLVQMLMSGEIEGLFELAGVAFFHGIMVGQEMYKPTENELESLYKKESPDA